MTQQPQRNLGHSLIEIMAVLTLLLVFASALYASATFALRAGEDIAHALELQQALRITLQIVTRDLRNAGYDPAGALSAGIVVARADRIEVLCDRNGDGDAADPRERFGYRHNRATRTLQRTFGNAPPQPMLNDVAELRFSYFGADGSPIESGPTSLIRRIHVTLALESAQRRGTAPLRAERTVMVTLRNE